jgi:hypothetical protein
VLLCCPIECDGHGQVDAVLAVTVPVWIGPDVGSYATTYPQDVAALENGTCIPVFQTVVDEDAVVAKVTRDSGYRHSLCNLRACRQLTQCTRVRVRSTQSELTWPWRCLYGQLEAGVPDLNAPDGPWWTLSDLPPAGLQSVAATAQLPSFVSALEAVGKFHQLSFTGCEAACEAGAAHAGCVAEVEEEAASAAACAAAGMGFVSTAECAVLHSALATRHTAVGSHNYAGIHPVRPCRCRGVPMECPSHGS